MVVVSVQVHAEIVDLGANNRNRPVKIMRHKSVLSDLYSGRALGEQFEIALSRSDYAVLEERCRDWGEETLRQVSEWACVDVKHTIIERCGGSER